MIASRKPSKRKAQIAEKATQLFREKGYAASSMRDLATVLGIEAASLYSHIRSKEEILRDICFRMAEQFFDEIKTIDEGSPSATEKLRRAITAHIKVITRNPDASAVFFHEWRHLSGDHLEQFTQLRDEYEELFLKIIEQGVEAGEFVSLDGKFAMLMILSSLNWTHQWYKPTGKMAPEEIGDRLANLIIHGIASDDSQG